MKSTACIWALRQAGICSNWGTRSNRIVHNLNFQTVSSLQMWQFPRFNQPRKPVVIQSVCPHPISELYYKSSLKKTLSTLTVPPLSTWNINLCSPLASTRPPRYLTFFRSVTPSWFSVVDELGPLSALLGLCCAEVLQRSEGIFLLERGSLLIWLLRDSTGVLASRQSGCRYKWTGLWGGVTAGCLRLFGEGFRGQMERLGENIPDIFWLTDGKSFMQAS